MKTALLAFDSKQFNLILSQMLNDLGFLVIEARSFENAVMQCCEKQPNVMLTDWFFDGQNVRDLFEKVAPFNEIVLISDKNTSSAIQMALNLGVKEYIMKPFDSDSLQNKLAMLELI